LLVALLLALTLPASAASVRISEFLADNAGGLRDADGQSPDWIELHNESALPVNLAGWRLTDSAGAPAKWIFPAVNLPANGYLVVFASGKNRAVAGGELHTNFQLARDGGYLALVQPDGVVAQEFAPAYPRQRPNVSYGTDTQTILTPLLAAGSPSRLLVPLDGGLGSAWTATTFDDAAWASGPVGVGFDRSASGGGNGDGNGSVVLSVDFNAMIGETGAANTEIGFTGMTTNTNPSTINGITLTLSALDGAILADRDRAAPTPTATLTEDQLYDDFIFAAGLTNGNGLRLRLTGLLPDQDYFVKIWSYDNSSPNARVSDWVENASGTTRVITNGYSFDGTVLPTQDGQFTFGGTVRSSATGVLQIDGRRSGGVSHGVFLNALQLTQLGFGSLIATDLGAAMSNVNATAYVRVPFAVADPAAWPTLRLRMKYDDGFIAYLNGQLVASRNAPASPAWNSTSTATRPNADASLAEEFILGNPSALLLAGPNVLAIQGLNVSAGDADFLLSPELTGVVTMETAGRYLKPPTPGSVNGAAYTGFVADTKFSVDRGFFSTPFSVGLTTATAGATIRWTTNGAAPTETTGNVYAGPIAIGGTTCLRAAAFFPGLLPSDTDTHTYLFLAQVMTQPASPAGYPALWQSSYPADYGMDPTVVNHPVYGPILSNALRRLPTLSVVSDQNGLWNATTGIYPNATSSGAAWEREASLELIDGGGGTEFAVTAKIEMHGNASRDNARTPKHSLRATFSGDFGPTRLRYDWFNEPGATEHNKIILRGCGFVDGWAGRYADSATYTSTETGETFRGLRYRPENTCYLRDVWVKESFRQMGWPASRSQFVHLYLNGLYWGLYQPSEAIEASYFAETVGGLASAWDVIVGDDSDGPPIAVDGSVAGWQSVLNLVNPGITTEAAYQAVAQQVDLDNLIDYMLLHIFAESEDWPRHNWYVARRRATNGVSATKFVCTVWDQELTLDRLVRRNRINVGNTGGEIYGPGRVYSQLRAWPEFRRQFGDRVQRHLFNGGTLVPSNNVARLLAPAAIMRDGIIGESARWGDAREFAIGANPATGQTFTRDEWWQPEIDKLTTNFFQKLTADNIARFRAGTLYSQINAPVLNPWGGAVPAGFSLSMTHTNPSGVIYFTTDGTDPRVYGSGAVAPGAQAYTTPVPINAPTLIRARVLSSGTWSALVETTYYPPQDLSGLHLTEIMYNPPGLGPTNGDEFEFIELKNTGPASLNLSGLLFSDGLNFIFTNGSTLAPGAFAVLARNPAAFASRYPGVTVHGAFAGRLDNSGERLALALPTGSGVFAVNYDDDVPWPLAADNYGFSLVPKNPGSSQAPDDGSAWRASTFPGGSPGTDDPAPILPPIVINEILTGSVAPELDRIELFNPTDQAADLGGWLLSDDPSVPAKYRLADGTTIGPGGYLTLTETQFNPTPGLGNSFSLSSGGEGVYLFSADAATTNLTGYSHGWIFGAAAPGVSFGRYVNSVGEEQLPAQLATSFDAQNIGPRVGPVVIREIHYNPAPGGDEFLELANITDASVALFDPVSPTNTWRLNGLAFDFPTNLSLAARGVLILVATNPAAFRAKYAVPASVMVLGPYAGDLQDSGERLRLERPATPDTNSAAYIVVDEVRYNDKAPWPASADGGGASLQRVADASYGNDPVNWQAGVPTPGAAFTNGDADSDGLPDAWELENGTNPFLADAAADPDEDGLTNAQEYAAGTHPNQAASTLSVEALVPGAGRITLRFERAPQRSYRVLYKDSLDTLTWSLLTTIDAGDFAELVEVTDPGPATERFYRVVTP
jgi:hypothetical protein